MSKSHLQEGLAAYAQGDYAAAARAWTLARVESPNDEALAQYLQHLRMQAPLSVDEAEQELAAAQATRAADSDPWQGDTSLVPAIVVGADAPGLALIDDTARDRDQSGTSKEVLAARMRDAAELDDFDTALKAADEVLALDPHDTEARRVRDRTRAVLTQMHVSTLSTLDAIPVVAVPADQVIWLDLDQRAGFVLAQVDGRSSYNDIVSVTGMDELETLAILARLARDKIIRS